MDKYLERIMDFINKNTIYLIIICIFLIVILVIYLIDNTIKSKRLEQEEANKKEDPEKPVVLESEIPEKVEEPVKEETLEEAPAPVVEEVAEVAPTVVEPVVEEVKEETTEGPVIDSNIEELVNKDYSANNEIVENIPEVVEEPKSKYNNDKKLSDIFGKKEESTTRKIETTQDFSDELDRILQKLNNEETSNEDESIDYTNMF